MYHINASERNYIDNIIFKMVCYIVTIAQWQLMVTFVFLSCGNDMLCLIYWVEIYSYSLIRVSKLNCIHNILIEKALTSHMTCSRHSQKLHDIMCLFSCQFSYSGNLIFSCVFRCLMSHDTLLLLNKSYNSMIKRKWQNRNNHIPKKG